MAATPRKLGYRMPAEWEPHEATWLAWPHNRQDWPGRFEPIAWVYCEIVRKLARVERVRILIANTDLEDDARRKLKKAGADLDAVEFFPLRDRSCVDSRLLSAIRERPARRDCSDELALQRMGQVRRLETG